MLGKAQRNGRPLGGSIETPVLFFAFVDQSTHCNVQKVRLHC